MFIYPSSNWRKLLEGRKFGLRKDKVNQVRWGRRWILVFSWEQSKAESGDGYGDEGRVLINEQVLDE